MFRPLLLPRLLPLILLAGRTVALGGKSFFVSSPLDFANKNYALLTMCQPRGKIPLNVSLYLNPFQENQRIAFHRADIPLEVSSEVRNVTQVTVEAASWPVSLNIRQITFRLGQR
ncbi:unnamed protein product [Nippostrongylus brasiliensis]|uniref:DUF3868 domain-containing protein n=1 Tax=Nippostrongylus brasiliensis TaxID=27835 RepID=A0A0N4XGM5_NIPBR|nr:unnamed protein product [Nippostrongylus brasiliensis]